MSSPTQRSLSLLRERGYTACVVEKWIPQARKRVDAFSFGDILACKEGERILLVQTTTASNFGARYDKIIGLSEAETWLRCGGSICLHGWSLRGSRGKRKLWQCREHEFTILELACQRDEFFRRDFPLSLSPFGQINSEGKAGFWF